MTRYEGLGAEGGDGAGVGASVDVDVRGDSEQDTEGNGVDDDVVPLADARGDRVVDDDVRGNWDENEMIEGEGGHPEPLADWMSWLAVTVEDQLSVESSSLDQACP